MKINGSFLNVFQRPNINPINKVCFKFTNLAPLPFDTVSFGANKKAETLIKPENQPTDVEKIPTSYQDKILSRSEAVNLKLAKGLYQEADYAMNKLRFILKQTFGGIPVIDIDAPNREELETLAINQNSKDKNNPIVMIITRRKSPKSISEKMGAKHIKTKKDAKDKLSDIVGAKIIISGSNTDSGNYVIGKLIETIKARRLGVEQVKNHGQEKSSLNYASRGKINKFVDTARSNGNPLCTYKDEPRDSGYLGLHILTAPLDMGIKGEIQIIGLDVDRFKKLEDICYKCMAKKGVDKKYKPIQTMFNNLLKNDRAVNEYLEYIKRAYSYERSKAKHKKGRNEGFLPIPDDLNIPEALDFNNIAKLKKQIDNKKNNPTAFKKKEEN